MMLIKKLYENQDLSIERILAREQKKLKLTAEQLIILLALFNAYRRRTFTISSLSKKVDLSIAQIESGINYLMNHHFLTIYLETKDGKMREVFSLDGTFNKIEQIYQLEFEENKFQQVKNFLSETIEAFEVAMGKPLSAYELEMIRNWYEKSLYEHSDVVKVIQETSLNQRTTVTYVERLLNAKQVTALPVDDQADQVLDDLFKSIK